MTHYTRMGVLAVIFGVQAAGIVYARFVPTRFLCWAPYDQISFYLIDVAQEGRTLPPAKVAARYRMPPAGRENRSIHHVLNAIMHYEATYGRADPVTVRVTYRVNGRPEQTWTAPN